MIGVGAEFLGPLADNGGPTKTHALLPGSPAINAGDPSVSGLGQSDQRGEPFERVFSGRIDIGAYELQSFVVDTLVDENDGDYSPSDFSLREAIELANEIPGTNKIEFSPLLAGGTILMTMGEYAITDAVEIVGLGSELLAINAQQHSRVFNITATAGDFSFSGMTLTKGSTSGLGNAFGGGAIRSATSGVLSLDGMAFYENRTQGNAAGGGAVFAAGNVNISGSNFTNNQTSGSNASGGAISAMGLVMANSTVSGNSTNAANAPGGGINIGMQFGSGSPSSITDSIVTDNYTLGMSSRGGGIFSSAKMTIQSSTISGNITFGGNSAGGGLYTYIGGVFMDSAVSGNRTYGRNSPGGGAAGTSPRAVWQVLGTSFDGNETFGVTSGGGALAVGRQFTATGSSFQENSVVAGGGGAIYLTQTSTSQVTIASSTFIGNVASFGGAVSSRGNLTVIDSVLSGNRATGGSSSGTLGGGGAINQNGAGGILTVLRSKITANWVIGTDIYGGGGILSLARTTIADSEISNNRVIGQGARGGGLALASVSSPHSLVNSTISGNQITGDQTRGGGLYTQGRIQIQHSTITGNRINSSTGEAGGLWVDGGPGGGPTGPRVAISYSIIAGNFIGTTASDLRSQPILNYSLVGTQAGTGFVEAPIGSPDANGNLIGGPTHGVIDPLLGPLTDNGGPTKTHALLPGSPAINAGDPMPGDMPEFDQRGAPFARIAGGRIDIGAYESQPAAGLFHGDFDGDGDVDGRDLLTWQRGYGRLSSPPDRTTGDATLKGVVDGNDLAVWQETYGNELFVANGELRVEEGTGDGGQGTENEISDLGFLIADVEAEKVEQGSRTLPEDNSFVRPVDLAFEHWLPPRRLSADFGDIVVHRQSKRRAVG